MAVFDELFADLMPKLHEHFKNEGLEPLLWLSKWFQSFFLYSFPFDFCIRAMDNILAYGTRFMFNLSLAVLQSLEPQLLECGMTEIMEAFKEFKEDNGPDKLLPPVEELIEMAQKIYIPNERIKNLFSKHKLKEPAPKKVREERSNSRKTFTTEKREEPIAELPKKKVLKKKKKAVVPMGNQLEVTQQN